MMSAIRPSSTSSPDRPFLVNIRKVAELLGRSEDSVARDDRNGRLPRPIMLGSSKRWDLDEIRLWVTEKCPPRALWEARSDKSVTAAATTREPHHEAAARDGGA